MTMDVQKFDLRMVQCLVVVLLVSSPLVAGLQEKSLNGRRQSCSNEGQPVKNNITNCYHCKCQNGFVECFNYCPSVEGCLLVQKGACCKRCKGCTYKGILRDSHEEFTDDGDPCTVLRCEAGVITKSQIQCYTPCDNPLPPLRGQCCGRCPVCKVNGQIVHEGRDVIISDDPCLKCRCKEGKMVCSKKACPVLQCKSAHAVNTTGECCPRCTGTRSLLLKSRNCIVQDTVVSEGQNFHIDPWTSCTCKSETAVCTRPTCPILNCTSEFQQHVSGSSCKRCIMPELPAERTESCEYGGRSYEEGATWQLEACKSCECKGGKIRCAFMQCNMTLSCDAGSKLQKPPGECCPRCIEVPGTCMVFGDPHYKTFDGKIYTFRGLGRYQLIKDCEDNTFSIRVYNHQQQHEYSSMTKRIAINFGKTRINLQRQKDRSGRIKINGKHVRTFPQMDNNTYKVERIDGDTVVTLQNDVKLFWNGRSFIEVSVPAKYRSKLCGLCGNFNSNASDDFITREKVLVADNDVQKFGNSWCAAKNKRECANRIKLPMNIKYCLKQRFEAPCKHLTSDVFERCHTKLDYSKYLKACKTDMCTCPNGNCYCESIMAYTRECRRIGIQISTHKSYGRCFEEPTKKSVTKKIFKNPKYYLRFSEEQARPLMSNLTRSKHQSHRVGSIPIH